jgi:hypothetical protein
MHYLSMGLTDSLSAAAPFSLVSDRSDRQQTNECRDKGGSGQLPDVTLRHRENCSLRRGLGGRISR